MRTLIATLSSLAPGGAGVTHAEVGGERRAVFVANGAPGDRVRLEVDDSRRPARGRIVELLTPGPDRVSPVCPWSVACGGCDWMHLSLDAQERSHVDHVRAALPAAWRHAPIASVAAPSGLGYRSRARVHVHCGRGGRVTVGMNEARTHEPVEVAACAVLDPGVERVRATLSAFFDGCSGRGDVQIALGAGRVPVLDVRWAGGLAPTAFARFERAVANGAIAGAQVTERAAKRPARIGDPTPWMAGADGLPVRLAPGGFGQASERSNHGLATHVASLVNQSPGGVGGGPKAVELYAGAGNLSVLLARRVADLVCVESDAEACEAARANLAARALRARVVQGDADGYAWASATKLVVLDPPRAGARAVAERLAAARVPSVIYVSCDAQTLGRDLSLLASTYALCSVATFEMFPQTSHVETVVALARRRP